MLITVRSDGEQKFFHRNSPLTKSTQPQPKCSTTWIGSTCVQQRRWHFSVTATFQGNSIPSFLVYNCFKGPTCRLTKNPRRCTMQLHLRILKIISEQSFADW